MGTALICLVCVIAPAADTASLDGQSLPDSRSYHAISQDLSTFLKAEAKAVSAGERFEVVKKMSLLYREINADPRFPSSETLQGYKAKLWSRLHRLKETLESKNRRLARMPGKKLDDLDVLAPKSESHKPLNHESSDSHLAGSSSSNARAFGGGVGPADNSAALIDLIQSTIQPDSWNVNGGPGALYYFRPVHALVVRATSEVHEQLRGLMNGMRAAGAP